MKSQLPILTCVLAAGAHLACAGEGFSENTTRKESAFMSRGPDAMSDDVGELSSQQSGRKALDLAVDVAETTLSFVPLDQDFKVAWKKGNSCDRIEVTENASGLEIKHHDKDGSCGESKVEILVNEKLSTRFTGGAGYLKIRNTAKFLSYAEAVSASVMAGQIDSNVGEIMLDRSWSQMRALYRSESNSGIHLKITLGAGNIVFSR